MFGFMGSNFRVIESQKLVSGDGLKMFVDELPHIPKLFGYKHVHGRLVSNSLTIGMFQKTWVSSFFLCFFS